MLGSEPSIQNPESLHALDDDLAGQGRGNPQSSGVDLHDARLADAADAQFALVGEAHRVEQIAILATQVRGVQARPLAITKLSEGHRRTWAGVRRAMNSCLISSSAMELWG